MTAEEQRNLEVAKRYEELYNTNVERFVHECYASDYVAHAMGIGHFSGLDKFVEVEQKILHAAPRRIMRVDQFHASGNSVTVEAVLLDADKGSDWQIPFCAVLVCRDGKIIIDRTYADFRKWPGLSME